MADIEDATLEKIPESACLSQIRVNIHDLSIALSFVILSNTLTNKISLASLRRLIGRIRKSLTFRNRIG